MKTILRSPYVILKRTYLRNQVEEPFLSLHLHLVEALRQESLYLNLFHLDHKPSCIILSIKCQDIKENSKSYRWTKIWNLQHISAGHIKVQEILMMIIKQNSDANNAIVIHSSDIQQNYSSAKVLFFTS